MEIQETRGRQLGYKRKNVSMHKLQEKYFSEDEAARYLKIRETELDEIVSRGGLTAYNLGGKYIRFKRDDIERLKAKLAVRRRGSLAERLKDFLYFNSFYISAIIIVILMLLVILKF